jgi:ATP-dependent DNA helicase PIF1
MLSIEQENALKAIKEHKNVFISGNAGTGKSFLLKHIKETIPNIHITASTGIAAVNVGGQTLHSWSGIRLGNIPANKLMFSRKVISRIKLAKILAIDEISMISAEVLDLVNDVTKLIRKSDKAFGGIQVIFFGDFFQLPPVQGDFCFNSQTWTDLKMTSIILKKVFRQSDEIFVNMLNHIRYANLTPEDISLLTDRVKCKCSDVIQPTRLVSHNEQADRINKAELDKIDSKVYTFKAKYRGTDQLKIEFLKKNCVAYDILDLKIGSSVMMIRNTYAEQGIINGSVGIVKDISVFPVVLFENGVELNIISEVWELKIYDDMLGKLVTEASIEQIPLIFSWAITIHKSQGMTLGKIRCDLSEVFTYGQSYVALSRVKSLDGLYIDDIDFHKIRTSEMIVSFYENLEQN